MTNKKALTAPCGLDCFNCEIYKDNLTSDLAVESHKVIPVELQQSLEKSYHPG